MEEALPTLYRPTDRVAHLAVDRGDDGADMGATYEALAHWSAEAMEPIGELMAGVNAGLDAALDGPDALATAAPLLRGALLSAGVWLEAHPCPNEVLQHQLLLLVEEYSAALITIGLDPHQDWGNLKPVLDEQLMRLAGGFTEFLADLHVALEDL